MLRALFGLVMRLRVGSLALVVAACCASGLACSGRSHAGADVTAGGASGSAGGGAGGVGTASSGASGAGGGGAGSPAQRRLPADSLAVRFADMVLERWPEATQIRGGAPAFEYNVGIVLRGIEQVYRYTGDTRYRDYVQAFVDTFVNADGDFLAADGSSTLASGHSFDNTQPSVLLPFLYTETGDERYHTAAVSIRALYADWPRNAEGGFWHKDSYPDEMWLDSIYMAEPFLGRYAAVFEDCGAYCADTAYEQTLLLASHVEQPSGLFLHAWDEDKSAAWADPVTGTSGFVWGRAMGWYAMALVELLDTLPVDDSRRPALVELLGSIAAGLRDTQDATSGLWYQVVDAGDLADNWLETSASGMFVYALEVGVDRGYLDASFLGPAQAGWAGLLTQVSDDADGLLVIDGAVQGMGVQTSYANYVNKQRLSNSPHGLCAILLAASEMESLP